MASAMVDLGAVPAFWNRRHLLGLEDLSAEEITLILDKAEVFKQAMAAGQRKIPLLTGKTCVNLFFENSTRTRNSFSLAARRLGADTLDFSASTSSLSKGETFIDTAKNIEAMGVDLVIVRHRTPGTPHLLAQNLRCGVINAGDGPHEHPTQGLLDILTIRQRRGPARRSDGRPGGRHRPQPHGAVEHLGPEEAWGACDRLRPVHAGFAPLGGVGRGILVQSGRDPAPGRRVESACGSSSSGNTPGRSLRCANTPTCTRWIAIGWPRPSRTS